MSYYKITCKLKRDENTFYLIFFENREEYLSDMKIGELSKKDNEFISVAEYLGQSDRYSGLFMDGHDLESVEIDIVETNDLIHTIADCGNYNCRDKYGDKRNWCLKCYDAQNN